MFCQSVIVSLSSRGLSRDGVLRRDAGLATRLFKEFCAKTRYNIQNDTTYIPIVFDSTT